MFFCVLFCNLSVGQSNNQMLNTTTLDVQALDSKKNIHKPTNQNTQGTLQTSNELVHIDSTNAHLYVPNIQTIERKPE